MIFRDALNRHVGEQAPADASAWDRAVGELAATDAWRPLLDGASPYRSTSIHTRSPERNGSGFPALEYERRRVF